MKEERASREDRMNSSVHLSEDGRGVTIIDQTLLPGKRVYLQLEKAEEMYDAIKRLAVRGAPALGIFGGYAMYVRALHLSEEGGDFRRLLQEEGEYLVSSRPTAVNLSWAVDRQLRILEEGKDWPIEKVQQRMKEEAILIHNEDIEMCRRIGEYGLTLLKEGGGILTHCNAGPLATSKYGTATAPVFLGKEKGVHFHVFCDETRPLLQGARLTSYELTRAGIDCTLICDNMASMVMKNGWVQACLVGCDRIAANGDFANKIGTSGLAILANYYGIPFYTLGPSSTIDMDCPTGDAIPIELREPEEIRTLWYEKPMALEETACYNPAFDVTDHRLLTAIITDRGIVYPPFEENLEKLFK